MPFEKFKLDKKCALITGASGLLGKEHAIALLEAGAHVIITDINSQQLNSRFEELSTDFGSDRITKIIMDVSKKENIHSALKKIKLKKYRIDILLNNAAIDSKVHNKLNLNNRSRMENFSLNDWNKEIEVGLTGAFMCCQIFGSEMAKDSRGGVILNIASDLSVISPDQRLYKLKDLANNKQPVKPVTYSVIKSGLVGLTKYVATYWAEQNIRCNSISPGGIFNNQDKLFVDRIKKLIPMNRMAQREEYRSSIQYLCSDASSYMTGQNIVIDGGRSVW